MCDAFCVLGDGVTLFAKNSDRPRSEPQVVAGHPRRPPGSVLRTQYLEIPDPGAYATVLSRPPWLWGAEHGLNEHRVAIGNEMVFTADDPRPAAPALIGMDLVRLGLEAARSADEALDVMTTLLERHGQGGVGDETHGLAYWSSFLVADPTAAWVLETSGPRWAARPVTAGAAISNRLTLGRDWTRASPDVVVGTDIDSWRHPDLPTGFADVRLAAGRRFVAAATAARHPVCDPRAAVAALRDHGPGPWGAPDIPGAPAGAARPCDPPPEADETSPHGDGWTLCLHAGDTAVTTASLVALLPADAHAPARAWAALGSPCLSIYVPVPAPGRAHGPGPGPSPALGDARVWRRFADLRDAVGTDGPALQAARAELAPVEDRLWEEADTLVHDAADWESFGLRAAGAVGDALDRLAAAGLGPAPGGSPGDR